jgi:hypothetical protein
MDRVANHSVLGVLAQNTDGIVDDVCVCVGGGGGRGPS